MCRSIVEDMALTGKCLEVNTALRAACGAAKMIALSQGVECPYVIDKEQFKGQCEPDINLKLKESTRDQYKRAYVFLRAVQQGVAPPINIAALPEEEEKALINDLRTTINEFKSSIPKEIVDIWLEHGGFETDLYESSTLAKTSYKNVNDLKKQISSQFHIYICERFLRINPAKYSNINESFNDFIRGDQGNGLRAYDCIKKVNITEADLTRFFGYFRYSPSYLEYQIQDFSYPHLKGRPMAAMLARTAPHNINDINVILVDKYKLRLNNTPQTDIKQKPIPGTKKGIQIYDNKTGDIIAGQYTDSLYVTLNDNIKLYSSDTAVTDISNQQSLRDVFIKNAAMDIHPYLMYLLQMDPWASTTFMANSFGGNMTPQQFPLAFYIVAHFVANQKYAKNPADFYRKPIAEKKPEMLAALNANNKELTQRIADGYTWLGADNPGIGKLLVSLGGNLAAAAHRVKSVAGKVAAGFGTAGAAIRGVFTRSQAKKQGKQGQGQGQGGGRRVTRKNRIAQAHL